MKKIFFACWILLGLSGCGWTPLYGTQPAETRAEMAAIDILPIANAAGFAMRADLQARLNPTGAAAAKKYALAVEILPVQSFYQNIQTDYFASGEHLTATARYELRDRETGRTLLASSSKAVGSYSIIRDPYATIVTRQKTEQDLMKMLTSDIIQNVISFLNESAHENQAAANPRP
ncbi:MAG: hypothetical protein PHX68_04340 [Alphaproteobacteria bacterium]|nr:hypothetical protein [Alphaproteobacteria bacterium]